MSISRSQASALADNFLDDIGSDDKDELQPRETFTELILLAGEFIESAQENLIRSNSNASGELSKSLIITEPVLSGSTLSVNVMMNQYGEFINSGVKGTKSGAGKYQFKYDTPSKKMVQALLKSTRRAKRSTTNVRRSVSANESKNKKISEIDKAYGAGRNIKMYGIKANGFIDKAVKETEQKVSDRLGVAFVMDVFNSI